MPRFSIKDLMLAITLVAIGFSIEYALFSYEPSPSSDIGPGLNTLASAVFSAGAAMIGAGLLAPFHRKAIGAGIGVVLSLAFLVVALLTSGH